MRGMMNNILLKLNKEFWLLLGISVAMFLFTLIFKPFRVNQMDFDGTTFFKVGFGAIIFLVILLVRVVYPSLVKNNPQINQDVQFFPIISGFIIWLLSSLLIYFYLREVGLIHPTFYTIFKIALICLVPPIILNTHDKIALLKQRNKALILDEIVMQKKVGQIEETNLNKSIVFNANKNAQKFKVLSSEILLFKSANNYVEVYYMDGANVQKKLIRNTLRNIEHRMKPYPDFIRCHRICLVNVQYIEKLNGNCNHHTIILKGFDEPIPVSRQYFLKIKEAL